jgi:hypothetical protein
MFAARRVVRGRDRRAAGTLLCMQNGDAQRTLHERAGRLPVAPAGRPRRASPDDLDGAEAAAASEEYREWLAAGRPGAVSHEQARGLLLGPGHG